ncbi:hypothetical protein Tco_0462540 [Tanacetum coccineum]
MVYPNSDEEDEEYYSLPPLLPCFQTPQPCAIINSMHHNSHNEVDIDNMTLEEYARYKLAMSSMKSVIQVPTHGPTSQFFNQSQHIPNPPLDNEDSSLNEILDDLFRIGVDNIRSIEHEVPNRCDDETVDITDYEDSDQMVNFLTFLLSPLLMYFLVFVIRLKKILILALRRKKRSYNLGKDPFLVVMELNDRSSFLLYTIPSSISNEVCSLETLMRLHSSTWATKGFKWLVAYAKCNRDSYENELGLLKRVDWCLVNTWLQGSKSNPD